MRLVDLIFPVPCVACGAPGTAICDGCSRQLLAAAPFPTPVGLDSCAALVQFEGVGRQLVTAVKYRNNRAGLERFAAAMVSLAAEHPIDQVTWAPTTAQHRRERGFDQAELLARSLSRQLRAPARALLVREHGNGQTGRSAAQRLQPTGFRGRGPVAGAILLVDDVVTTGSTMTAAAMALRQAGAHEVHGLALAHTPPPSRSS